MPEKNTMPLTYRDRPAIALWLACCAALVFLMVMVGGYTRLSGSGLSITEWKPVHGTLPPLSETEWQEEFEAYRQSPQYQQVNQGMNMEEFRTIFWPEYLHRLMGRLIGLAFLVPLIVFAFRRSISKLFGLRLLCIFALGGLQGLIGWLMVKSGLVDMPRVSHIRLAMHLGMALLIFSLILWSLFDVLQPKRDKIVPNRATGWYKFWFFLVICQLLLGAFVAGLHGGLIYNTYPTMNDQWIPDGILSMSPFYINFIENITLIQFLHRKLALAVVLGFLLWWYSHKEYVKNNGLGRGCAGVALVIAVQFLLGVLTLLHQAPLALALAHQMVAVVLLAACVSLLHKVTTQKERIS